jgi:hypothetical protein
MIENMEVSPPESGGNEALVLPFEINRVRRLMIWIEKILPLC